MDSVQATAPTLLPITADLANLTVGISMHHITVRLMRMWEARNFKKSDELMSLELLLVDNKGFAVTASIHHRRIPYYIDSMREGEIYEEADERRKMMLSQILYSQARERIAQIALVKPEKAKGVEDIILRAAQMGQIVERVSEERLITLLEQINSQTTKQTKVTIQRRRGVDDD